MARAAKPRTRNRQLGILIIGALIIIAAVLVIIFWDRLSLTRGEKTNGVAQPYTYENGSNQAFALMGKSLAVASSTGMELLDTDGYSVMREVFSMDEPAVCAGDSLCAFYDVGGLTLRVTDGSELKTLDTEQPIISVDINSSGFMAVATEETGYKGAVTVYDSEQKPIFQWFSGSGYVLSAVVSPDSGRLAVLCLENTGSVIHFFKTDSDKELSTAYLPNELAFRLEYCDDGTLCALSEKALNFIGKNGDIVSSYSFDGERLVNYELTGSMRILVLGSYVSGSEVTVLSLSQGGSLLGKTALNGEPLSLSSRGEKLLVLSSTGVMLYTRELTQSGKGDAAAGYKQALLLPRDEALLLASHHGEKCKLR